MVVCRLKLILNNIQRKLMIIKEVGGREQQTLIGIELDFIITALLLGKVMKVLIEAFW